MLTFKGLYDRVAKMNTDKVINESFDNTLTDLENVNRERMNDGLRADGTVMPTYSYISQVAYGYPNSPIKLKATGAFQAGIIAQREGEIIKTTSIDPKTMKLEKKYGEAYGTSVFGLSKDYKKQYQDDHLSPEINKKITAATGLKFVK